MSRPSVYSLRTRDLANAGEVVDVVLLDIRAGEIADRPFEHVPRELVARTVCGTPTGANVLPQSRRRPRCTPSRGERFSNAQKPLRNVMLGGERGQHDALQIPLRRRSSALEWQRASLQPDRQERRLLQRA